MLSHSAQTGHNRNVDPIASPASTAPAPDWSVQTEEIHCPLCDYNLRGLTEPRCPECGYQFEWIKLTDPAQRKHPYLFEHHPERNISSFVQTMIGSLKPRRFWTILHPQQASRPGRMVAYWVLNLLLVLVPSAVMAAPYFTDYYRYTTASRTNFLNGMKSGPSQRQITQQFGSVEKYADLVVPRPFGLTAVRRILSRASPYLYLIAAGFAYLLWPWCGVLLFALYRQSMRRARIRPGHVLRCLIYSADGTILLLAGVLPMAFMFAVYYFHLNRLPPSFTVYGWLRIVGFVAVPLVWLASTYRMIVAYRRYLQFPHAAAVVIVTEVILFLGLLCILTLMLNTHDMGRMLHLW